LLAVSVEILRFWTQVRAAAAEVVPSASVDDELVPLIK